MEHEPPRTILSAREKLKDALPRLQEALRETTPRPLKGKVRRMLGMILHASVTDVRIGEICRLTDPGSQRSVLAEVIGIVDDEAVLSPLGELSGLSGLTEVLPTGRPLVVPVGAGLLGRTISPLGEPLDDGPWPPQNMETTYPVLADPPPPLTRDLMSEPLSLGIRALDGCLTCARGQRLGIFGEPGTGKSTLIAEIARGTDADVVVVGLVGERGREVREFIDRQLGPEDRAKSVLVVATSDRPAMERVKAAYVATAVAEYFRDRGQHVLLLMDSLTRFARAQREIGLAAGEPPTRRGFPPSLFAALPRLVERTGLTEHGSITGIYSVLVEGDGMLDPVAEEVQAILDGHIVLSADMAQRNHFPAIDVLRSRSRLMETVAGPDHRRNASRLRRLLARYAEIELLLRVGEYTSGGDPLADEAIARIDRINAFLQQTPGEKTSLSATQKALSEVLA